MAKDLLNKNPKWTIGIVNFRSIDYIEYQLKILYEFNNPNEFELIIVDNSEPSEIDELQNLASKYISKYQNLILIKADSNDLAVDKQSIAHHQHANGMNTILKNTKGKYLLVQDPDFFWTQKNYLDIFEKEFENGAVCIGAPYGVQIKTGNPDFPSAFGCAYITNMLTEYSCDFHCGDVAQRRDEHKFVSWKMRAAFSSMKYVSFSQTISSLPLFFGEHSYLSIPRYYTYNNKTIGYHLFRGSFVATNSAKDLGNQKNLNIQKQKVDTRYLYSRYFYSLISNAKFSFIKEIGFVKILKNLIILLFFKWKLDEDGSTNPYHIRVLAKPWRKRLKNKIREYVKKI